MFQNDIIPWRWLVTGLATTSIFACHSMSVPSTVPPVDNSLSHLLRERGLDTVLRSLTQPVLGICLGLQLLCRHSEEGNTDCLGVFGEKVKKFEPMPGFKVPHMGWNTLERSRSPLFEGLPEEAYVYFVHSFYAETGPETIAQTRYTVPFSAALQKENFYATQFHPEKSSEVGARILSNFLAL